MEVIMNYPENSTPIQHVYISKNDITNLIKSISDRGYDIAKLSYNDIKSMDESIISPETEIIIAPFLTEMSLLGKISSKFNKQIENIYSPLMRIQNKTEYSVDIEQYGRTTFFQDIKKSEKFDFMTTKEFIAKSGFDLTRAEDKLKFEKYLEETAGFALAKSNLEATLKSKGYLDEQVEQGLNNFIYKETTYKKSIVLPIVNHYDPTVRVNIIFTDISFMGNDGLIQNNPEEIITFGKIISSTLASYNSYAKKVIGIIEELGFTGKYIGLTTKEKNSIKFSGLFQDNKGNKVDVTEELIKMFQLTNEEVNEFVNSRKRNLISLPNQLINPTNETYEIFTYEAERLKFEINYGFTDSSGSDNDE